MTRKERLLATLAGRAVDRPAVNFYELNGLTQKPEGPDPFNIFSHPSWKPLLELAAAKTDRIVIGRVPLRNAPADPVREATEEKIWEDENGSRHTYRTVNAGGRTLTQSYRRDRDVDTLWQTEHLLKGPDDLKAYLDLPEPDLGGEPDVHGFLELERQLGDTGITMVDTPDPLCLAADLFDMGEYTIVALTEKDLFHRALERFAKVLHYKTEKVAAALPGRLWRIYGPEYAAPPYLPPSFYDEYVVRYVKPMVETIHASGGYARIHSHGMLKDILPMIVSTGADGLDPIEPPRQGDVELAYVREKYGRQLVLFGNLEITDIENLPRAGMVEKVERALDEGTTGEGRGFVLMPSACPYGRVLPQNTLANYRAIIDVMEKRYGEIHD